MCQCETENLFVICKAGGDLSVCFDIKVIDKQRNIVDQCCCPAGRRAVFSVPFCEEYMVVAKPCEGIGPTNPMGFCSWVVLRPGCGCTKFFLFDVLPRPAFVDVQFFLKDAYYENLPIEKGELYLWPSM